jgi:hypothetical protein
MRSFLKRIFGRQGDGADNPSPAPSECHFEMVLTAVDILAQFALELRALRPPDIPGTIASTRGWTIRFEALEECCRNVPTKSLQSLAEQLERPIEVLTSYVRRWDQHVSGIDPLLRTYEIMPGEEDAVDSVRVLLDRAIRAQQVAVKELSIRSKKT